MVQTKQSGKPIDFSIMPSFRCNLNCWFCMYDAGPNNKQVLNYEKTKLFLNKFDWNQINAFGFYGGEPSIDMPLYDKFIELVPKEITNKFVITNGTWSKDDQKTFEFLNWCSYHKFHIIISGTPEHKQYQWRSWLEKFAPETNGEIELKEPDEIHAQGRAAQFYWVQHDCKKSCLKTDRNIRLGLKPDGNIVFQNCHGEYHIVQTYENEFDGILERTEVIKQKCLASKG